MSTFLEAIALAYSERYTDLSDFCFVFPNKRSGSFFIRSLADIWRQPRMAPEITTISDLASSVSGLIPDSRLDMLFRLYDCYCRLVTANPNNVIVPDFDRFRLWGDTVINDLSEVDMQMVDPDAIFKNVKDFREISSNFLTESQKEVMEEYFGYTGAWDGEDSFWKSFSDYDFSLADTVDMQGRQGGLTADTGQFDPDAGFPETPRRDGGASATAVSRKSAKGKFIYLWRIMGPLYHMLSASLRDEGLATPGGCYRSAVELLESGSEPDYCRGRKFVFVGFNALTNSERRLMAALAEREVTVGSGGDGKECGADFFWDLPGPLLTERNLPAARFVASNRRRMPEPQWSRPYLEKCMPDSLPQEIRAIAVPSDSQQVKIISRIISSAAESGGASGFHITADDMEEARAAVVLADEQMLLPLLTSMPSGVGTVNLTMGYPLRLTPVVSYVNLIRRMQRRQRMSGGHTEFFFDDVRMVLSHPYSQVVFGSRLINEYLAGHRRRRHITVRASDLMSLSEGARHIFSPLGSDARAMAVAEYIDTALALAEAALPRNEEALLKRRLEHSNIAAYRQALVRLAECLRRYGTDMSRDSVFVLADRLMAAETVAFEGEPLHGLQVMGMLETRALDFDYIFLPGVEDKKLPRRGRSRTFIPNSIRRGYGMPPSNYQEEMFAYYFYRLIGRSKRVVLTYDSRGGNSRGGGISRFILQLRHLFAKGVLKEESARFALRKRENHIAPIEKDKDAMARLARFMSEAASEEALYFSASALSSYCRCQRHFFFRHVCRMNDDPDPVETISPITHGDIVHSVMMNLYVPEITKQGILLPSPKEITEEYVAGILADRQRLVEEVYRWVNYHHFQFREAADLGRPLTGSARFVAPVIVDQIENILRYDMSQTPFSLHGVEIRQRIKYPLSDGRCVNVSFTIDRLDSRKDENGNTAVRIVDYKTGSVHLEADSAESVFNGDYRASNILQLLFYATMLERYCRDHGDTSETTAIAGCEDSGFRLEIYNVPKILNAPSAARFPKVNGSVVRSHHELSEYFNKALDAKLCEILDPGIPFAPAEKQSGCGYCGFHAMCGR